MNPHASVSEQDPFVLEMTPVAVEAIRCWSRMPAQWIVTALGMLKENLDEGDSMRESLKRSLCAPGGEKRLAELALATAIADTDTPGGLLLIALLFAEAEADSPVDRPPEFLAKLDTYWAPTDQHSARQRLHATALEIRAEAERSVVS